MARRNGHGRDHSRVMAYVGLGITIVLNAISVGYVYGGMSFRVSALELNHTRIEKKVDDFSQLATDMAVVKNQLVSINEQLKKLSEQFTSKK